MPVKKTRGRSTKKGMKRRRPARAAARKTSATLRRGRGRPRKTGSARKRR